MTKKAKIVAVLLVASLAANAGQMISQAKATRTLAEADGLLYRGYALLTECMARLPP